MVRSLGFATDLAVLQQEGALIEERHGVTVVRTTANPTFRWGNFVLVPEATDPEGLARVHAAAVPGAGFTAIGVDDAEPTVDELRWRAAGFTVERNIVLVAAGLDAPSAHERVHEARTEADWAGVLAVAVEGATDPSHLEFLSLRVAAHRTSVEAGRAVWLVAEADDHPVAAVGVVDTGAGTCRYQDVGTLAAHRRRGLASALLRAGAAVAADRFAAERLVLVAAPDGPAIGLYRRLGFRDEERQMQLERLLPAPNDEG